MENKKIERKSIWKKWKKESCVKQNLKERKKERKKE